MSRRTARQLFEDVIIPSIDLNVTIRQIISSDELVEFEVCELKWLRKDLFFTDERSQVWTVSGVDITNNMVYALKPAEDAELNARETIVLQAPTPRFGTINIVNGEMNLEEINGTINFPIIWLVESITGKGFDKFDNRGLEADYVFYCLDHTNLVDYLNKQRHDFGVVPMTALAESVIEAIESHPQLTLENGYSFKEFPIFGREAEKGVKSYIIGKNLAGVEYRASVSATKTVCNC